MSTTSGRRPCPVCRRRTSSTSRWWCRTSTRPVRSQPEPPRWGSSTSASGTAPAAAGARYAERVLVDADPGRPTNVNLRAVGDPVWRETLLFRDWLRADPANRDAYLAEKRRLEQQTDHVDAYSAGKLGWITGALGRAEHWAAATAWQP